MAMRPRAPGRQRECLEWYRGTRARDMPRPPTGGGVVHYTGARMAREGKRSIHRWLPFTRREAGCVGADEGGGRQKEATRGTNWV